MQQYPEPRTTKNNTHSRPRRTCLALLLMIILTAATLYCFSRGGTTDNIALSVAFSIAAIAIGLWVISA